MTEQTERSGGGAGAEINEDFLTHWDPWSDLHTARCNANKSSCRHSVPIMNRKEGTSPSAVTLVNSSPALPVSLDNTPPMASLSASVEVPSLTQLRLSTHVIHARRESSHSAQYTLSPKEAISRRDNRTTHSEEQGCMLRTHRPNQLPLTAADALVLCASHLNHYERKEILEYTHVYYCGGHARVESLDMDPIQTTSSFSYSSSSSSSCLSSESGSSPTSPLRSRGTFSEEDKDNVEACKFYSVNGNHIAYRYEILNVIGRGTYGTIVRALDHAAQPTPELCAIKIARRAQNYAKAVAQEAETLEQFKNVFGVAELRAHFRFRSHEVLVMPLYGIDLKSLLRVNHFRPLPLPLVASMAAQLVTALRVIHSGLVTHADIKPDNVVLTDRPTENDPFLAQNVEDPVHDEACPRRRHASVTWSLPSCSTSVTSRIVLLDFSNAQNGACAPRPHPVQTLSYRAPEVALGLPYGPEIDMWSLGCLLCELATGVPLFPAETETELLLRHAHALGMPPPNMGLMKPEDSTSDEKEKETGELKVEIAYSTLLQVLRIADPSLSTPSSSPWLIVDEMELRESNGPSAVTPAPLLLQLLDFLLGCLACDPAERLTPDEAAWHPFLASYFTHGDPQAALRCSGLHFLRTHSLTKNAAVLLSQAEQECAAHVSLWDPTAPQAPILNTQRTVQPIDEFRERRRHSGGAVDTPLRVALPRLFRSVSTIGGLEEPSTPHTTTFFDPIERVQVSIMSFEEC